MKRLVNGSLAAPMVRGTAVNIMRPVVPRDRVGQVEAVRSFLTERVQFLRDPVGVELLHSPEWLLREIQARYYVTGDCDDVAILSAALGKAAGLKARFVAVAFYDPVAPYAHVWTDLFDGDQWRDLDVTRKSQNLASKGISRRLIFPV
jgi:transglutaminase-like putative cysteine protease